MVQYSDRSSNRYANRQYGSNQRWLTKALREVAHRVEELVIGLSADELRWRPADDEWCATEVVGFLRDSEREDLVAVRAMIRRDGAFIEERRALFGPLENDYRSAEVTDLLWDFQMLREETVWTLHTAGAAWEHTGEHPYRGLVPLGRWVHEINERDLDAMWKLQRIVGDAPDGVRPRERYMVRSRLESS